MTELEVWIGLCVVLIIIICLPICPGGTCDITKRKR